jgi:hypothetical protein
LKINKLPIIFTPIAVALPILLYFVLLQKYAVNIPLFDDHALKAFLVNYLKTDTFLQKLTEIFRQHNEHRIALTRVVTLLSYWSKGVIDYRFLMLFGNIFLIGILVIFWKIFKKINLPSYFFLPVPFLLFHLQHSENTFWGMAAVQNFGIVFWLLLVFYFLNSTKSWGIFWAIIAQFVATFTSGNGFLGAVVGLVILALQKRYKHGAIWLVMSGLMAVLYFFDYEKPKGNPASGSFSMSLFTKGGLSFLGSLADILPLNPLDSRILLASVLGGIILFSILIITFVVIYRSDFFRKHNQSDGFDYFVLSVLMLVGATTLIVTFSRIGFGLHTMLTGRYKIYSVIALISCYLFAVKYLRNRALQLFWSVAFLGSVAFNLVSNYAYFEDVVAHRNLMISNQFNAYFETEKVTKEKVPYQFSKFFFDGNLEKITGKVVGGDTDHGIGVVGEDTNHGIGHGSSVSLSDTKEIFSVNIKGNEFENNLTDGTFLALQSSVKTHLFPTSQLKNSKKKFLLGGSYFTNECQGIIAKNELPDGVYKINAIEVVGNKIKSIKTIKDSVWVKDLAPTKHNVNW